MNTDKLYRYQGGNFIEYGREKGLNVIPGNIYHDDQGIMWIYSYEGLVRLCQSSGKMAEMLEAAREAVRRWPDDENFMERYLYANLIAGNDVELALERALSLLAKRPDDSTIKLCAAVGYYWFDWEPSKPGEYTLVVRQKVGKGRAKKSESRFCRVVGKKTI